MKTTKPDHWSLLFGLWSIQGLAAFLWLVLIPTDTEHPLAFGFSSARLALIGMALVLTAVSVMLWLLSRRESFRQTWLDLDKHPLFWDFTYLAALLAVLGSISVLAAVPLFKNDPLYLVYAARLHPILLWVGLAALELAALIAWIRYDNARTVFATLKPIWKTVIFSLVFFFLLGIVVIVTRIGITPDDNWGDAPIPFLEWQILLTLMFLGVLLFFPPVISRNRQKWIPFGIYIFTVLLWLSQPIHTAYTATTPRQPNFEIYPFSDAQFYAEYAQSALTGNGFTWPEIPARPFYVGVLTWFHLLGNQDYKNIIVLQTLVLAFFPVVLYLLGKEIGGIPLGLSLSILAAFRDINANIAVPFASNVTYSKLYLSELPAALLIGLVTLLSICWLRSSRPPAWLSLLIGGLLGAAALVRLQSSVLLVPLVVLAFFVLPNWKQWAKGSILIGIGFAIVIVPWLTRNYIAAGGLILDNPISQTMTMARRWSGSMGNELLPKLPGENDAQYSSRLTRMAIESFKQHPDFILRTAANHFVNSEITSLLAFPARDEILSPSEIFTPQHTFWKTPLVSSQLPLFVLYVLLFSVGVAAAWHYHGLIGWLPLALGLVYNLWTALFMSSGERFIVPLDWSVHLYEFFGLLLLGGLLLSFIQRTRETILAWIQRPYVVQTLAEESSALSRRRFLLSLIFVLFLGAFLPLTESIFPQRYPPRSQEEILQQISETAQPGETAIYGRAIFPRYYEAGDGEPGTAKLGYGEAEEARLVFFLVGRQYGLVIFEPEDVPEFFPSGADVYMVGTQEENYFSPRVIKVVEGSQTELYTKK
ncbi:MAG TPA: hypothetical protein VK897_16135 [Anaerolineales bacterium]|nr:hypothetical protein [Anaerolineales bacterium]